MAPTSSLATARVLGSGYSGYGMANLSLDWSVIGSAGGLYTPWFGTSTDPQSLICELMILSRPLNSES